jgi:hypothetical protein
MAQAIDTSICHSPAPPCHCAGCIASTIRADQRRIEIITLLVDVDPQYSATWRDADELRFVRAESRWRR